MIVGAVGDVTKSSGNLGGPRREYYVPSASTCVFLADKTHLIIPLRIIVVPPNAAQTFTAAVVLTIWDHLFTKDHPQAWTYG